MQNPVEQAKPILEKIEKHNHQAFLVGGCVRDLLLERQIGDIDIATSAPPHVIKQIFDKVIPVGIEHGTVIVRYQHVSYEVTTFRVDGKYSDRRHPDTVEFIQTIDQDLKRRDFTINALAMDRYGKIIDLFNGKQDLQLKLIRTVGNGYQRFTEDPLRIIRALRFSSQLGFTIEEETLTHMELVQQQLRGIAVERMTVELTKLFAGDFATKGIQYLKRTNIYKQLPIMVEYPYIIDRLPQDIKPLASFGEVIALFHYLEPAVSILDWVQAWKCSNKIKHEAEQLVRALYYYLENGLDNFLVYQLDVKFYEGFVRLCDNLLENSSLSFDNLQKIEAGLPIKKKQDLRINGSDLILLFPEARRGPWIQMYLNLLEKQVVTGKIKNNKNQLKDWIKWNPPEIN